MIDLGRKVFNIQNCSDFAYISSCFPWYFNAQTIDVTVVVGAIHHGMVLIFYSLSFLDRQML